MADASTLFAVVAIVAATAALCVGIAFACRLSRRKRIVSESPRVRGLLALNSQVDFRDAPTPRNLSSLEKSKAAFDRFDARAFLVADIEANVDWYDSWLQTLDINRVNWENYLRAIDLLPPSKYAKPRWVRDEARSLAGLRLSEPSAEAIVVVTCSYSSPKGRNTYRNSRTFDRPAIDSAVRETKRILAQKGSRQALIARERMLMTDALRYEVLRRDGFRCVICGSEASDGVKLHVDHIHPVSKGGKTEVGNLRTLCDRCNLGKGARVE